MSTTMTGTTAAPSAPAQARAAGPALEVRDLATHFPTRAGVIRAVDGISFTVSPGETLGLVGESGSGKSVTGFSIMGLIDPPGRIAHGQILFGGRDIARLPEAQMRTLRGRHIAMVFQDPMATLNPVLRIGTQVEEAVQAHGRVSARVAHDRARDALGLVGIPSPEERLASYPHQLSGGMRQRVAIAIALLHRPALVIADEPTTALDVTIQAQILAEMQNLTRRFNTALVWITHDLSVIAGLADRVAVMYAGRIVEQGGVDAVLDTPCHQYTAGLLGSVPSRNKKGDRLRGIPGTTPSLLALPKGCAFQTRCRRADDKCTEDPPEMEATPGHFHRCWHPVTQPGAAA